MQAKTRENLTIGALAAPALLAVGIAAFPGPIARMVSGEEPSLPSLPEAHRERIQLVLGIDATASDIQKDQPTVKRATKEFLTDTAVLADGDSVVLCTIGGKDAGAQCQEYTFSGDNAGLIAAIDGIPSDLQNTWIRPALRTMVGQSNSSIPRVGIVWSDFIEGWGPTTLGDPVDVTTPFPMHFMVPGTEYLPKATRMREFVHGEGQTLVADSGSEVATVLKQVVDPLTQTAMQKAEGERDVAYAQTKADYDQQLAQREGTLKTVRTIVSSVAGGLAAFFGGGAFLLNRYRNRPQLTGVIVDVRTKKNPQPLYLNGFGVTAQLAQLDSTLPKVVLTAGKTGITTNSGLLLTNEMQIEPGVYYFTNENLPDRKALKTLHTNYTLSTHP